MAFYLFLPLNASSAAIRFAGEKVKGILETPETEAAVTKHQKQLHYQHQEQRQQQIPAHGSVNRQVKGPAVTPASSKRVVSPPLSGRAR